MLIDTLQAVLQSARRAFEIATGDRVEEQSLASLDVHEATYRFSAVLSHREGAIATIVVGCDQEVVERIVAQTTSPEERDPHASHEDRLRGGFRTLLSVFQHALGQLAGESALPLDAPVQFGPGNLPATFQGGRRFCVRVAGTSGSLDVIVSAVAGADVPDMPTDEPGLDEPGADPTEQPKHETISGARLERLMDQLAEAGAEVQLDIGVRTARAGLHAGALVPVAATEGPPALGVATPFLADHTEELEAGRAVTGYVMHAGRLLVFWTTVLGVEDRAVDDDASIALLVLRRPARMLSGQRRRAQRVVPRRHVDVELRPLPSPAVGSPTLFTSAELVDVSFLGVGLRALGPPASPLEEGDLVLCRLTLPRPWGIAELPGIVRRLIEPSEPDAERSIGIEFLGHPSIEEHVRSLGAVREFVLAENAAPVHGAA